jgi:outer membrane protein assembly factor BamC
LGTLSYSVKQEGFSPYESDAETGIFYVHYRKVDPDGPGWFSRRWSSIRNAKWVTAIFGQPESERVKLKSPYTLAELTANLPQGAALDQAPMSDRDEEKTLPDAPGYLVIVTGKEGDLVVRVRDPYGKRLEPRKAREMLTTLRKNLI